MEIEDGNLFMAFTVLIFMKAAFTQYIFVHVRYTKLCPGSMKS